MYTVVLLSPIHKREMTKEIVMKGKQTIFGWFFIFWILIFFCSVMVTMNDHEY